MLHKLFRDSLKSTAMLKMTLQQDIMTLTRISTNHMAK